METRSRIWAMVFLTAVLVTLAKCDGRCPQGSSEFGDECFTFHVLKHDRDILKAKSAAFATEACDDLSLGQLNWWLPKADSVAKNDFIGQFFHQQTDAKGSSIWLGLRRYENGGGNDSIAWAAPRKWFWTVDNTSIALMVKQNIDLWEQNQPTTGEQCAILSIEANFQWRSARCEYKDQEKAPDIGGIVCEARLGKEIPIHERPWFYAVCGSLVALSVFILVLAGVIYCRHKKSPYRTNRKKKQSDLSVIQREAIPQQATLPMKKPRWYVYSRWHVDPPIKAAAKSSLSPLAAKTKVKDVDDEDSVAGYSNLQVIKAETGSKKETKSKVAGKKSPVSTVRSPTGRIAASIRTPVSLVGASMQSKLPSQRTEKKTQRKATQRKS